jgi:hypothetical protein
MESLEVGNNGVLLAFVEHAVDERSVVAPQQWEMDAEVAENRGVARFRRQIGGGSGWSSRPTR